MGQYYYVVNLDKREYLHPSRLGDGLKLMEFGRAADGTMTALAVLLADGNGRGGGDFEADHPLVGSWAGDRIVIAGDYADPGKFLTAADREAADQVAIEIGTDPGSVNLHDFARQRFLDISGVVRECLALDGSVELSPSRGEYEPDPVLAEIQSRRAALASNLDPRGGE